MKLYYVCRVSVYCFGCTVCLLATVTLIMHMSQQMSINDCVQFKGTYGSDLAHAHLLVHILHGTSMFAVKAKIYGVQYNQASSIAFDETSSYCSALKSS